MMPIRDEENSGFADSLESVDAINKRFYGRFQYPWAPMAFERLTDSDFERVMLNQSVGSWDQSIIPRNPRIWIAGCGTNQAVFTALRFPDATILGTDLSAASLETAAALARKLGISNVEFRQESINDVTYREEFDYLICTGVIHHNADPKAPLAKLSNALKPTGILELMVYNRYHRTETTAFQKSIRILGGNASATEVDFESEMQIARKVIRGFKIQNSMSKFLEQYQDCPEAKFADALLQPVEYSFTVESLEALVVDFGLELLAPCINQFDKTSGTFLWNMEFDDSSLQDLYDSLPDARRWQVSNCLMLRRSPMLWFYLARSDSGREKKSEQLLCEEFLKQTFVPAKTTKKVYVKTASEDYALNERLLPYPAPHINQICAKIVALAAEQPGTSMRRILQGLGMEEKFSLVNKLRLCLTTNAFPYLVASK